MQKVITRIKKLRKPEGNSSSILYLLSGECQILFYFSKLERLTLDQIKINQDDPN